MRQSMDGKNRWADNIMIERWFRSFKYEEAYLTQYNNIREARKAIGKYVHTYNFERCHSALNNQTLASCYYPILLLDDHAA
ncbi:integrase core domain-containing protein [Blautia stercoris]